MKNFKFKLFACLILTLGLCSSIKAQFTTDFTGLCVDSIWYESTNNNLINVRVQHFGTSQINYPSVQIFDLQANAIGNPLNTVNFFAHLAGETKIYTDSVSVVGITDFSNYTIRMSANFGDTSAIVPICGITNNKIIVRNKLTVSPNPFSNQINIHLKAHSNANLFIYNSSGALVKKHSLNNTLNAIDTEELMPGVYFIQIQYETNTENYKLLKH